MKLKRATILFDTVCILNTMTEGCGFASECTSKIEETQAGKASPQEFNDAPLKGVNGNAEGPQENTAGKWQALEPDVASAIDTDILDSQVIYVVFEEDTHFYLKGTDENEEGHGNERAGFQDLKEHMYIEM